LTRKQFAVIASRLRQELRNTRLLLDELARQGLLPGTRRSLVTLDPRDSFTLRAIGSILHDFYVAAEYIFETVARNLDDLSPTGPEWHRELLRQMTLSVPGIRPALLTTETADRLDEFRAFRHVFRNVYGFNLSSQRLQELLRALPDTVSRLEEEVNEFIADMQEILPEEPLR